jgi:hypothetical protein
MTIAEFAKGRLSRHKLLLQTIRIEQAEDGDTYFFKDGSSIKFPREVK